MECCPIRRLKNNVVWFPVKQEEDNKVYFFHRAEGTSMCLPRYRNILLLLRNKPHHPLLRVKFKKD